jgi:hypothetical protein
MKTKSLVHHRIEKRSFARELFVRRVLDGEAGKQLGSNALLQVWMAAKFNQDPRQGG